MRKTIYFLMIALLFACNEKPKDELIDLKDIISHSGNEVNAEKPAEEKDTLSQLFDLDLSLELGLPVNGISVYEQPMFPERFSSKSFLKLCLRTEDDSILFCQWTYKDSLKTMNAFFNWIDCFGTKCKSLKYMKEDKFQSDALLIFLNDTSITYVSGKSFLDEKAWQKYLEKRYGVEEWDRVIVQKRNRKAEWFQFGPIPKGKENVFTKLIQQP